MATKRKVAPHSVRQKAVELIKNGKTNSQISEYFNGTLSKNAIKSMRQRLVNLKLIKGQLKLVSLLDSI